MASILQMLVIQRNLMGNWRSSGKKYLEILRSLMLSFKIIAVFLKMSIKAGDKSKIQSLVQLHIAPQLPAKLGGFKIIIWDNPEHNYGYRVISTALLKELREIQKEAIETFGNELTADISRTHHMCDNWAKYALDQNRFSAIATKVLKKNNIEPAKPFYQLNYDEYKSEKFDYTLFPCVNNDEIIAVSGSSDSLLVNYNKKNTNLIP
eukprot:NODE_189_length_13483_cov_0.581067.p6 type:complete len:207 gc:universal NODE_189_length_13483_cov_0.581067:11417-12037(+)